ncbi:MAG: ATP-binding protein [Acidimicrobiia bacterium]|nr:ATP-binding protein [Acidimicrobiia bacterium]MYC58252.1 ATP-binding protein [Acidimicrobiia bacterium]MYI30058.1 ATP-binding protein [Acidimicrobiia bacterium]
MPETRNPNYLSRVVDHEVVEALASSPAVLIEGPRGCGKTWTGQRFANSEVFLDGSEVLRIAAEVDPNSILEGAEPRLLDEWQLTRGIWNPMRHACDRRGGFGHFLLTGSQNPPDDITEHSGAGRVARVRMRLMSLWESGDSSGEVSLASLLAGERCLAKDAEQTYNSIASLICRGGWPRMIQMVPNIAQARLRDYLDNITRTDLSRVSGIKRNPQLIARLLASLARNEATTASCATLIEDIASEDGSSLARSTIRAYLDELTRLFVLEPLPAWATHLRSSARLRKSSKRFFVDPALAVAALAASVDTVAQDREAMGLLFESMAIRDLRVYAQSLCAHLYYYGDSNGLEADAVIEGLDGQWAVVEIKLGGGEGIGKAIKSLRAVRSQIDTTRRGEPSRLIVLTAFGHGYQTDDGIAIVPLTALKP